MLSLMLNVSNLYDVIGFVMYLYIRALVTDLINIV